MKSKSWVFTTVLVAVLMMSSCVQNNFDFSKDPTIDGVTVPGDFDWSTITTTSLTVIPTDEYDGRYYYVIEVFGENPLINSAAPLLAKGVAKENNNFVTGLVLPTYTKEIFVRETDPARKVILQSVQVTDAPLQCKFSPVNLQAASSPRKSAVSGPALRSAQFETEYPTPSVVTTLNAGSADVGWTNNVNYLIPEGVTYTGSIQLGTNSNLYIEGTYALANKESLSMASGGRIVIQSGGKLQVPSSVDLSFYIGSIINFGSVVAQGKFTLNSNALLYNQGTMSFADFTATNATDEIRNEGVFNATKMSVQSNPFTNIGTMNIGVFELATNCNLINNGTVIAGELDAKSNSRIQNKCNLQVNTLMDVHGIEYDGYQGSLLKTPHLVSDGTVYNLSEQSMMDIVLAEFTTYRNYINGVGTSYALARIGKVDSYQKAVSKNITYQGKVEIECSNHKANEKNNPFWVVEGSDVRWAAAGHSTTNITACDCNAGGNVITPTEPGNPTDPTFPIVVNLTTNYSFIMEDNWPYLGDYDLNDIVVDLSISYLQNADNKATEMSVIYKLRAVGASKQIAAGFRLDKILSGQVSSVSYQRSLLTGSVFKTEKGGLEKGQSKAVIPLFDDAHTLLNPSISGTSMLNTIIGSEYFQPVADTIRIVFENPVDPADISIPNINFFIVTSPDANAATRTEVHLSGYEPTDKANMTLFGTGADYSFNGSRYRTKDNMIWGLLIPTSFNYAAEFRDITAVYPGFAAWCTSGGVDSPYWYEYPTDKSGYVFSK